MCLFFCWHWRHGELHSFPTRRSSDLGFDDLEAPRRLEAAPYVVTKNVSEFTSTGIGRTQDIAGGGDLKYRVASRSEEHTSELQSRLHLVCRLPPEKKKVAASTSTSSS